MQIDLSPAVRHTTFAGALGRCYLAAAVAGLPLAALMLTPGLLRSRVALAPGITSVGILGFVLLSAALICCAPMLSALVAPGRAWRFGLARQVSSALRRQFPRAWWRRLGEAGLIFVASQVVGGLVAAMIPYIWLEDGEWVLDYGNYAMQALSMYAVIVLAAAWFGTRIRQLVVAADVVGGHAGAGPTLEG